MPRAGPFKLNKSCSSSSCQLTRATRVGARSQRPLCISHQFGKASRTTGMSRYCERGAAFLRPRPHSPLRGCRFPYLASVAYPFHFAAFPPPPPLVHSFGESRRHTCHTKSYHHQPLRLFCNLFISKRRKITELHVCSNFSGLWLSPCGS